MTKKINVSVFVFAAASALVACASTTPVEQPKKAATNATPPVTTTAATTPVKNNKLPSYRRVTKNGQVYFCHREGVTGSRTQVVETCLTQAQLDEASKSGQDLLNRIQSSPVDGPKVDANGARTGGVMGQ